MRDEPRPRRPAAEPASEVGKLPDLCAVCGAQWGTDHKPQCVGLGLVTSVDKLKPGAPVAPAAGDAVLRGLEVCLRCGRQPCACAVAEGPTQRVNPARDWERPDGSLNHEPLIALIRELSELNPGARQRVIRSLVVWFDIGA